MKEIYSDITSRIAEPPSWWDENGTPRYGEFSPDRSPNIYADQVALLLIACQACGQEFRVEMNAGYWSRDTNRAPREWHYGDPPRHDCVGDTMNCNDMAVLEFWTRRHARNWERHPLLEVPVDDAQASEEE